MDFLLEHTIEFAFNLLEFSLELVGAYRDAAREWDRAVLKDVPKAPQ